ncbi:MAG: hypothetical protein KA155_07615 [Alphaproteobacteria bacterium]|jgi:hypothetical protein|nr:hypothetical protein [Alphaproteobacteria bacterium]
MKNIIFLFTVLVLSACNPFKITDPSNPRFKPENFSFKDYGNRESYIQAFKILFPIGTKKEFVESVLVEAGGAKTQNDKTSHTMIYMYEPFLAELHCCKNFSVEYDNAGRVEQVYVGAAKVHVE